MKYQHENEYYNRNNLKNGKDNISVSNLKTIDILGSIRDKNNPNLYHKDVVIQIKGRPKQTLDIVCNKILLDFINEIIDHDYMYTGVVVDERGNDPILRIYLHDEKGKKICNRDIRFEVLSLVAYYNLTGYINENICKDMVDIIYKLSEDIMSVPTSSFNKFDYVHFKSKYNYEPDNIAIIPTNEAFRQDKDDEFLYSMFRDVDRFRRIYKQRFEDYCNNEYSEILKSKYNRDDTFVVTQCQNILRKGDKIYAEVEDTLGNVDIISLKIPNLSDKRINRLNNKYMEQNMDYIHEVHALIESILDKHALTAKRFLVRLNTSLKDKLVHYKELEFDTLKVIEDSHVTRPYSNKKIKDINIYKEILGE